MKRRTFGIRYSGTVSSVTLENVFRRAHATRSSVFAEERGDPARSRTLSIRREFPNLGDPGIFRNRLESVQQRRVVRNES
jgi:hypothetical protein